MASEGIDGLGDITLDGIDIQLDSLRNFDDDSLKCVTWNGRTVRKITTPPLSYKPPLPSLPDPYAPSSRFNHAVENFNKDKEFCAYLNAEEPFWQFAEPAPYHQSDSFENSSLEELLQRSGYQFAEDEQCAPIIQCKGIGYYWQKYVVKPVKKTVKKTVEFVKEHKKEVLITGGAIALGGAAYVVASPLLEAGAATLMGSLFSSDDEEERKRKTHSEPPKVEHNPPPPPPAPPPQPIGLPQIQPPPLPTKDPATAILDDMFKGIARPLQPPTDFTLKKPDSVPAYDPPSSLPAQPPSPPPAPSLSALSQSPPKAPAEVFFDNLLKEALPPSPADFILKKPDSAPVYDPPSPLPAQPPSVPPVSSLSALSQPPPKTQVEAFFDNLFKQVLPPSPENFSALKKPDSTPIYDPPSLPPAQPPSPTLIPSLSTLSQPPSKTQVEAFFDNLFKQVVPPENFSALKKPDLPPQTSESSTTPLSEKDVEDVSKNIRNQILYTYQFAKELCEAANDPTLSKECLPQQESVKEFMNIVDETLAEKLKDYRAEASLPTTLSESLRTMAPLKSVIPKVQSTPAHFPDNPKRSVYFETAGETCDSMSIGFIPGMSNSIGGAIANLEHLHTFAPQYKIKGVYNHSNFFGVGDFFEIPLNLFGCSPVTKDLLVKQWTEFHEKNKDRPYAKMLQVCHSQGAIHANNALRGLSQEIRERIIFLAVAPGEIIPEEMCYRSYNFASERDFIPLAASVLKQWGAICGGEDVEYWLQTFQGQRDQLVILKPEPEAPFHDHAFSSPTFAPRIKDIIEEYIKNNGEYTEPKKHKTSK